ncbi:MAG: glycosyltransferase family 9 protein [Bacteroidetes bacterium]|nr:glycosyltransferase family 9 protein [Bacteroidota bacterium]
MKLPANIRKIAVFRALQLGDMLCVIPAIRALRRAFPKAEITLLGLPWAKWLTERFDNYFDRFIHFPGFPGLPEQVFDAAKFAEFLPVMQRQEFDLVLQMQGSGSVVNPMIELFGTKFTAGFCIEGHYAPDNGLFMPYPAYGSEIDRHLALMEFLGIPSQGNELEFPLTATDLQELNCLGLDIEPKRYICVHPGSRGVWRQWPAEHFAALADFCFEQGYKVVITGTRDEKTITSDVIRRMGFEAIDTTGKTSIGAVAALISDAALLISNCTGVSHIAAALKTPSVVISMDGEPNRWRPINKQLHRTINWLQLPDFDLVFRVTAELVNQLDAGVLSAH